MISPAIAAYSVNDNYLELPNIKFNCKTGKLYAELKQQDCNNGMVDQFDTIFASSASSRRHKDSSSNSGSTWSGSLVAKFRQKTLGFSKLFCCLMALTPSSEVRMEPCITDKMFAVYEMQNNKKKRWNKHKKNKNKRDGEHNGESSQSQKQEEQHKFKTKKNKSKSKKKSYSESTCEESSVAVRKFKKSKKKNKNKNVNLDRRANSYETTEDSSSASNQMNCIKALRLIAPNLVFTASNDANLISSSVSSNEASTSSGVDVNSSASSDAKIIPPASSDAKLISNDVSENKLSELQKLLLSVPPPTMLFAQNNHVNSNVQAQFQSPPPPYLNSGIWLDEADKLAIAQNVFLASEVNHDSAGQDEVESDKDAELYEQNFKEEFKDLRKIWSSSNDATDSPGKVDADTVGNDLRTTTAPANLHNLLREAEDYNAVEQGLYQPYRYNFPKLPDPEDLSPGDKENYDPFGDMLTRLEQLHNEWKEPFGPKLATEEPSMDDQLVDFNTAHLDKLFHKLGIRPSKDEEFVNVGDNVQESKPFLVDPIMEQELQSNSSEESEEEPTLTQEDLDRIMEGRVRYQRVQQWVDKHH